LKKSFSYLFNILHQSYSKYFSKQNAINNLRRIRRGESNICIIRINESDIVQNLKFKKKGENPLPS